MEEVSIKIKLTKKGLEELIDSTVLWIDSYDDECNNSFESVIVESLMRKGLESFILEDYPEEMREE